LIYVSTETNGKGGGVVLNGAAYGGSIERAPGKGGEVPKTGGKVLEFRREVRNEPWGQASSYKKLH